MYIAHNVGAIVRALIARSFAGNYTLFNDVHTRLCNVMKLLQFGIMKMCVIVVLVLIYYDSLGHYRDFR